MGNSDVLRHSLIDRFGAADLAGDVVEARIGIRELKIAIRRDLEWLLNTRRLLDHGIENHPEAKRSVVTFGLPDLSAYSRVSADDRRSVCELIADAVRTFEPRLASDSIQVTEIGATDDPADTRLHFQIAATIHVEPLREPVRFDTSLDPNTGALVIEEDPDA